MRSVTSDDRDGDDDDVFETFENGTFITFRIFLQSAILESFRMRNQLSLEIFSDYYQYDILLLYYLI